MAFASSLTGQPAKSKSPMIPFTPRVYGIVEANSTLHKSDARRKTWQSSDPKPSVNEKENVLEEI